MIRHQVPAALAAALLLIGLTGCNRDENASATTTRTAEAVVTVGPENIAIATIGELRSGPAVSGSLEPEHAATVRAEVGGSVLRTNVDAGQRVKRGQLLAAIDDRAVRESHLSARSSVRSAQTALDLARRNLERTERLEQAGALPERDLESARLDVTNAEGALADARARLTSAAEQLEDTRVRAPFDGIVSERQADAGDVVQVGAALFSIVDPSRLRLEASVPADQIGRLRQGTEVEFTVTGVDRRITGQIERINPVVDSTTRQVRIYVSIPNLDRALVAGLFAEGRVATDTKRAVAVPLTAVDSRGNTPKVHLIKRGRVAESDVQLGVRDEAAELVELQAGVAAGDTVLLGSAQGVTPGSRIQVLQEEAGR
jgi:membrane fusion protein, multidrug efflux system